MQPVVSTHLQPDVLLPLEPVGSEAAPAFDASSATVFQAKMKRAPLWFCSFLAGNSREKRRLRDEPWFLDRHRKQRARKLQS